MPEQLRPFANASEYVCWLAINCDRCSKGWLAMPEPERSETGAGPCDLDNAVADAHATGAAITEAVAQRMGFMFCDGETRDAEYEWRCPEFNARKDLKA